jgi:hypothetical protein
MAAVHKEHGEGIPLPSTLTLFQLHAFLARDFLLSSVSSSETIVQSASVQCTASFDQSYRIRGIFPGMAFPYLLHSMIPLNIWLSFIVLLPIAILCLCLSTNVKNCRTWSPQSCHLL